MQNALNCIRPAWRRHRYITKMMLVMKLTVLLLTVAFLNVSATGLSQNITFSGQKVPLKDVLSAIKKQTGFVAFYPEADIKSARPVTIKANNLPLEQFLSEIFKFQHLEYNVKGKNIFIVSRPATRSSDRPINLYLTDHLSDTLIDIKGRVVDEKGDPLAGVNVVVKGIGRGTTTNANGEFELKNVGGNTVIVISSVGYEARIVNSKDKVILSGIILKKATSQLDEVQIMAYGTTTKRFNTGNISTVKAADIEKQPINNVLTALQSRVPGLEITQQTGMPGGNFIVRIRGRNSIASGLEPLYIIDGVAHPSVKINTYGNDNQSPFPGGVSPLSTINPYDIQSVEVLKDADATSIYGSRGANGVILITTKKGSAGEIKIDVNFSKGWGQVAKKLKLLNTEQYLAMRMEAFKNDGLNPGPQDYDVNGTWDKNKHTDWQKEFIGGTAKTTNASMAVSGGSYNTNYLVSANYSSTGTIFPADFSLRRGGVHTNLNFGSAKSRFKTSLFLTITRTTTKDPQNDITFHINRAPNAPDSYDQYGQVNWENNTVIINSRAQLLNTEEASTDRVFGSMNVSYRIAKGLTIKTDLAYDVLKREQLDKSPNNARRPAATLTSASRKSVFGNSSNISWSVDPQLNYETQFGISRLTALVGMSFQESSIERRSINATNFNSDNLMDNISSATVFSIGQSDYSTYRYAALLARLSYNISQKYFLNATVRRDGSSRFGPGNQFANFGSLGAAWIFSDEKLIKESLPFLSFGKLRASYGTSGNDQIQDYQYLQLFESSAGYQGTPALRRTKLSNPDYAWESTRKAEAAIQVGFLKDKLTFQVAYFINRSSNQLTSMPLPYSVGAVSVISNLPAVVQNNGLEVEAEVKWTDNKNWSWFTSFNLAKINNKLVSYKDFGKSPYTNTYIIGQPLDITKYYNTSVDRQTGSYIFDDKDASGTMNAPDMYLLKNLRPDFSGGLNNSIRYKQFSLDLFISFVKQLGKSPMNGKSASGIFSGGELTNHLIMALDRWQKPGDDARLSKFTTLRNASNIGTFTGSEAIKDASFARLKNVSLSYSFSPVFLSRFNIKGLSANIQGHNVLTLTSYEGLDPETQGVVYPPLRMIAIGLNLTL